MPHKYTINGLFLTQNLAGLGRTGRELLIELDKISEGMDLELCIPSGCRDCVPDLDNIRIAEVGEKDAPRWTTRILRRYAAGNGRRILNITTQYSTVRHSIVTMADVRYMEKDSSGEYYDSRRFRMMCLVQTIIGIMHSDKIVTISEFSKERIRKFFRVPEKKIQVINCGWQHFDRISEDDSIFERFPQLQDGGYYFTVGTLAAHKNHKWIKDVSLRDPAELFVICGGVDPAIWSDGLPDRTDSNLIFTGFLSDGEMKALMKRAKAFLFPSLYEGFGIPPLEAMSAGTDCIVSDLPVHREIFGGSVHYIDPLDTDVDLERILNEELTESKEEVLSRYSWEKAAGQWLDLIRE